MRQISASLEDLDSGAINVFLFVSGLSVYTRLETIPGSSSSYLLSVFDIFHKYLSKVQLSISGHISLLEKPHRIRETLLYLKRSMLIA